MESPRRAPAAEKDERCLHDAMQAALAVLGNDDAIGRLGLLATCDHDHCTSGNQQSCNATNQQRRLGASVSQFIAGFLVLRTIVRI